MECPHCGAELAVQANGEKAVCEKCRYVLFIKSRSDYKLEWAKRYAAEMGYGCR